MREGEFPPGDTVAAGEVWAVIAARLRGAGLAGRPLRFVLDAEPGAPEVSRAAAEEWAARLAAAGLLVRYVLEPSPGGPVVTVDLAARAPVDYTHWSEYADKDDPGGGSAGP